MAFRTDSKSSGMLSFESPEVETGGRQVITIFPGKQKWFWKSSLEFHEKSNIYFNENCICTSHFDKDICALNHSLH